MRWMEKVKLSDICSPKQWKTIPTSDLLNEGYPVYGANGIIGYYNEYNHENPVVTVTCRGATCGSINITVPKAYVTGNAMCLDDLKNDIEIEYLYYCLKHYDFKNVISGSAQPQITRQGMDKIYIMLCSREEQRDIVNKLKKTEKVIKLRKQELQLLDDLVNARFVEMFGDPIHNPLGWDMVTFDECLTSIENGKSFVCDSNAREGEHPGILKLSAATYGVYKPEENKAIIDSNDFVKSAEVHNGDLLFTRKNTPELVGMAAYVEITPNKLMMPDLIFRLNTNSKCNKIYMWKLINHDLYRRQVESAASGSAKSMSNISKERLGRLRLPLPPIKLQNEFADFVKQVNKSKVEIQKALDKTQMLFDSLMQEYFG